jgi:hypothetical protein
MPDDTSSALTFGPGQKARMLRRLGGMIYVLTLLGAAVVPGFLYFVSFAPEDSPAWSHIEAMSQMQAAPEL